jgi:membrane protein required for colicin V production
MGIIDIVLLVVIGIVAIKGLIRGFVMEVFGLIALAAGYFVSYKYSHIFAKPAAALGLGEKASGAMGYVLAFLVAYFLTVIIGAFLSKAFKEVNLGWLNRGGGFLFGGLKGAVILGLIVSAVVTIAPKDATFSKNLQKGLVSGSLMKISPYVYDLMNKIPDVKKINPFDIPEIKDVKDKLNLLENESVQDALDAVKGSGEDLKDLGQKAADKINGLTDEKPLEKLEEELQKTE